MTGAKVPFLVSDVPCPGVVSVQESVLNTPELGAHPGAEAGSDLALCPPVGEPETNHLVLWGETPTAGVGAAELPSCCLERINPLLPVTEPCGSSMSAMPFSFTISKVLLLLVAELCVGLLCLVSSESVPLSIASAAGEEASLPATSLSPTVNQNQRCNASYNANIYQELSIWDSSLIAPLRCLLNRVHLSLWMHLYPHYPWLDQWADEKIHMHQEHV